MSCVVKNKQFKEAAKRNNISTALLETIVYKYINDETLGGLTGDFPNDSYILALLEGDVNIVTSEELVNIYQQFYAEPILTKNKAEALRIKEEAIKYFPEEAVKINQKYDNSYDVVVSEPVLLQDLKETLLDNTVYYNIINNSTNAEDDLLNALRKEGLVHRYGLGKQYMLTLNTKDLTFNNQLKNYPTRKDFIERAKNNIINRLKLLNLPISLLAFKNNNGVEEVNINTDILSNIKDSISLGIPLKDVTAINNLALFMQDTFSVLFGGILTQAQANNMIGNIKANAFIKNNKVYVVKNKVTADTVAEEFLHPFVNALYNNSPEHFNELLKEALRLFPKLKYQILSLYWKNKKIKYNNADIQQELVTQALSREFRVAWEKSLIEGSKTSSQVIKEIQLASNFYSKAWRYITALFNHLAEKIIGTKVRFSVEDLKGLNIQQIAELINASDSLFWVNHKDKTRFNLTLDDTINVHWGSGDNKELSNFASRPFKYPVKGLDFSMQFDSVEQAFQWMKTRYADSDANSAKWRPSKKAIDVEIMETTNGAQLRSLGRQIKGLDVATWDKESEGILKDFMLRSFKQNPSAAQNLLSTGKAQFTHINKNLSEEQRFKNNDKYETLFPKLLTKVREELKSVFPEYVPKTLEQKNLEKKTIEYTPTGKERQTYTIQGKHIYNKEGKEVFAGESIDRNKIFANLAVKENRADVVTYREHQYVVTNKGEITSVATGKIMKLDDNNGDRKNILSLSKVYKDALAKEVEKIEPSITDQIVQHLRNIGITVFGREDIARFLRTNNIKDIQQAIEENKEMAEIKAKAIADGTFMKAPNGKPTNLTERQWLQVRTKNFIKWFGDWINDPAKASKVVDENGEPLVVYHHSDDPNLTEFSTDFENYFAKDGGTKEAIFFDEEKTGTLNRKYDFPVFLNIRELNEYNETKQQLHDRGTTYREIVNESAIKNSKTGGVHMKDFDDNKKEHQSIWIIHNPNQVKSATNNNGEFSTVNDDVQMFIGKKARANFESYIKKNRPDISDSDIQQALDFLHTLPESKENTAFIKTAIKWIANNSIKLPQDNTKARQAFDLVRRKNIDVEKYRTLGELISSDEMKPKEKEKKSFNPDEAKTFSNKRTVTTESGKVFTIYDVENTEEGQKEVCKALAANYSVSPWCLSTFTATGKPTLSAESYWEHYNALQRKIAFIDGRPVAFNSDGPSTMPIQYNTIDGYRIPVALEWDSTDGIGKSQFNSETLQYLLDNKYVERNPNFDWVVREEAYKLTPLGKEKVTLYKEQPQFENRELWWDLTDTSHLSLSDDIVTDSKQLKGLHVEENGELVEPEQENLFNLEPEDYEPSPREYAERDFLFDLEQRISSIIAEKLGINFNEEVNGEVVWNLEDMHICERAAQTYMSELNYDLGAVITEDVINGNISVYDVTNNILTEEEIGKIKESAQEYYNLAKQELEEIHVVVAPNQNEDYWDLPFFMTPEGEVYGFIDKNNNIFLDETIITPEHPIHEYCHLWDKIIQQKNPELWNRGIELMKLVPQWNAVANDKNYGKKWESQGITGKELEDRIASEVHSRFVGKTGEKVLNELAQQKGKKNIVAKLRDWILEAWKNLKATFSEWSKEDLDKLTLVDFNRMTVRDFADGVSFGNKSIVEQVEEEKKQPLQLKPGNKLLTSIPYNTEQVNAIVSTTDWVMNGNPEEWYMIEGKAGTGKTTIVKEILYQIAQEWKKLGKRGPRIMYGALSHKAKSVLTNSFASLKAKNLRMEEGTIASLLGMKMDEATGAFRRTDNGIPPINKADIILIDEASMVNKEAFDLIMAFKRESAKVIFLGDKGQLPPIESDYSRQGLDSKTFDTKNISRLLVRVRQGEDSPILPYADHFWNNSMSDNPTNDPFKVPIKETIQKEGAILVARDSEDIKENLISAFRAAINTGNTNHIKYVCYTNAQRLNINSLIHDAILGTTENAQTGYSVGDFIVLNDSYTDPNSMSKEPTIYNSENAIVLSMSEKTYKDELGIQIFDMVIKTEEGKEHVIPVVARNDLENYKKALNTLAQKAKDAAASGNKSKAKTLWTLFWNYKQSHADIDFGYAITSHKSLGSTYDISIVDQNDIYSVGPTTSKAKSQSSYVGITRAKKVAVIINVNTEESTTKDIEEVASNIVSKAVNITGEGATTKDIIQAIKETEKDVINQLGGDEVAESEVKDVLKVAATGLTFEDALKGLEAFFSKLEQEQIKEALNGKHLKVLSASRRTDPAFLAEEVISFLKENAKKPLTDPTRIVAMEVWSKHDGLPIKDILDACKEYRVAPMVSFSITGLGNTALEKGVMKYLDMLQKIEELINNGTLNPASTTIRIDPILVGVTNMQDIENIVKKGKELGIKKYVTSLTQSYGYLEGTPRDRKVISGINNALASEGKTYDWDKYYGRDAAGKINFKPKKEYIEEVGNKLKELDSDPEITIQTCAFAIQGLKVSACLDPFIIEQVTGIDVLNKDGSYERDTSRPGCACYGCHGDIFKYDKECASSCAYCYAAHSDNNPLEYYNEDGSLKDIELTRTSREESVEELPSTDNNITIEQPKDLSVYTNHSGGANGSDSYWGEIGAQFGVKSNHYYHGYKTPKGNSLQSEEDFSEGKTKAELASKNMGRIFTSTYADLLARNWNQVKYSDAVFAIGHIVKTGEKNKKGYNVSATQVDGGTGYAVQMAINEGKPTYVFDLELNKWFMWDTKAKNFKEIPMPTLTANFAGIGTREINENGKKAIRDIYAHTMLALRESTLPGLELVRNKLKEQYKNDLGSSKLTDFVFDSLKLSGIKFKSNTELENSGLFVASENTIYYNPNAIQDNTLLHEAIHAATVYYIKYADKSKLSPEIRTAIAEIEECYNLLKEDYIKINYPNATQKGIDMMWQMDLAMNNLQALESPVELVAEITKPNVLNLIRDFDTRNKGKNIFSRLVDAILKLFGVRKEYTTLEKTLKNAMITLITHPNETIRKLYAIENKTIKDNVKKLQDTTNVVRWAHKDSLESLDSNTNEGVITLSIEMTESALFETNPNIKQPLSKANKNTILRYLRDGITTDMLITDKIKVNELDLTVSIPVRLLDAAFLSTHTFDIKTAENGSAYIDNIQPLPYTIVKKENANNTKQNDNKTVKLEIKNPVEKNRVLQERCEDFFKTINTEKVKLVPRFWKEEQYGTKQVSMEIYLADATEKGHFVVVKDVEPSNYSIHFKPVDKNNPKAFTEEEKEILFLAAADIIPEGGRLSTWGELSPGGIAGLNRFKMLGFIEVGTREVKTKEGQPIKIPIFEKSETSIRLTRNEDYFKKQRAFALSSDAIFESGAFTESELTEFCEDLAYWLDGYLQLYSENPELLFLHFEERRTLTEEKEWTEENKTKDLQLIQGKSHAQIAQFLGTAGIKTLIQRCFLNGTVNPYVLKHMRLVIVANNNLDAILYRMKDKTLELSKFTIDTVSEDNQKIVEKTAVDADGLSKEDDIEWIKENKLDAQEYWQTVVRTIDTINDLKENVRNLFNTIYELEDSGKTNEDGSIKYIPVVGNWGVNKRVPLKKVVQSLLSWTYGCKTLLLMISNLENKRESNPWVGQVIDVLKDNSGQYSSLQSLFFNDFCKAKQTYSIVTFEDGFFKSKIVNENPALKLITNSIVTDYKLGQHLLFSTTGIVKSKYNEFKSIVDLLLSIQANGFDSINIDSTSELIANCSLILGYPVELSTVKEAIKNENTFKTLVDNLSYILGNITKELNNVDYNPFSFDRTKNPNGIRGNLRQFLTPLVANIEEITVSTVYEDGKMYQSNVLHSYLTLMMDALRGNLEQFDDYIEKTYKECKYGELGWFYKNGKIRVPWLNTLSKMSLEEREKVFKHKVQLNFSKKGYMKNMSPEEFELSLLTEFFAPGISSSGKSYAWYSLPMISNKPSSEFILFIRHTGLGYKDSIKRELREIVKQEFSRIQTCRMRAATLKDSGIISNFDSKGLYFNFFPFLNTYLEENNTSELGILMKEMIAGVTTNYERLLKLIDNEVDNYLNSLAATTIERLKKSQMFDSLRQIENAGFSEEEIEANIENYVWNTFLAKANILELTVIDPAFYKDSDDLQKRLAQIHAPSIRPNVEATWLNKESGLWERVSDGIYRSVQLKDFSKKDVISNIIENLEIVFEKRIASDPTHAEGWQAMKERVISAFLDDMNVADAQGYNCPSSYRKKAIMYGKWNEKAEEIYLKLRNNEYTFADIEVAFQPLKPFVYGFRYEPSRVAEAPIEAIGIPTQFKNSEYMLIMADALLRNEDTGRPNLLRAIYDVMEESYKKDPTKGIDTILFESTTKSGLEDTINLNPFVEDKEGEKHAKEAMQKAIWGNNEHTPDNYINSVVAEMDYMSFGIQLNVPAHFEEHNLAHGSLGRYITISSLDNFNADGTPATITFRDGGKEKTLTVNQFKKEYELNISLNILEDIDNLEKEFGVGKYYINRLDKNTARSLALYNEIESSPRYGEDLLWACTINESGEFRIPLGDAIQSKRIEQLLNSIIKNRVNKQTLPGGPVVQVTNFGVSKRLNIRFKDKNNKNKILTKTAKDFKTIEEYKLYLRDNLGGIAYYECYAPIYSKKLFEEFADENGNIDIKEIEKVSPELLKMVGLRIPTEDKYSMAPLKIVGFLPREAGDGIMLPWEITVITGSDFDVDKFYLMHKTVNLRSKESALLDPNLRENIFESVTYRLKTMWGRDLTLGELNKINKEITAFITNPNSFKNATDPIRKQIYNTFLKSLAWEPKKGRLYRDNKIVDMTWAVLTSESEVDKILTPQGFDEEKKTAYAISAFKHEISKMQEDGIRFKDVDVKSLWKNLLAKDIKELKKISLEERNLCLDYDNVKYYQQNKAASTLLGMFAVQKIAHAILEGDDMYVNFEDLQLSPFTLFDNTYGEEPVLFTRENNNKGFKVGKQFGNLVGAAADAVKDPILNLILVNNMTAPVLATALKFGMTFLQAALLLSLSVITDVLLEYNQKNIQEYTALADIVNKKISELEETINQKQLSYNPENSVDYEALLKENFDEEKALEGLSSYADDKIKYQGLVIFKRMLRAAEAIKGPVFATRFNSIGNAVGPLAVDNLALEYLINKPFEGITDRTGNVKYKNATDVFKKHPILESFAKTIETAKELLDGVVVNSNGFRMLLNPLLNINVKKGSTLESQLLYLKETLYNDRNLLNKLADFYASYCLLLSGAIDSSKLKYYIEDFPEEFLRKNTGYKYKYKGNALIDAIKGDLYKDGRIVLTLDVGGLKETEKAVYKGAWLDLYKLNPKLAEDLFVYNFFRAGNVFSPKTFISLLPPRLKEKLFIDKETGESRYIQAYRRISKITKSEQDNMLILDLFIRNNIDNSKLVKSVKLKPAEVLEDTIYIGVSRNINSLYIKTAIKGLVYLYKLVDEHPGKYLTYEKIDALGNNHEFFEVSLNDIILSQLSVEQKESQLDSNESTEIIPNENDSSIEIQRDNILTAEQNEYNEKLLSLLFKETTGKEIETGKRRELIMDEFTKVFADKGLEFDRNLFKEELEKYC